MACIIPQCCLSINIWQLDSFWTIYIAIGYLWKKRNKWIYNLILWPGHRLITVRVVFFVCVLYIQRHSGGCTDRCCCSLAISTDDDALGKRETSIPIFFFVFVRNMHRHCLHYTAHTQPQCTNDLRTEMYLLTICGWWVTFRITINNSGVTMEQHR